MPRNLQIRKVKFQIKRTMDMIL